MKRSFKQFRTFVRKEFIHILRDPRTLMIIVGLPIMEMLIFGFALNMEVTGIQTYIVAPTQDALSQELTVKIAHNPYFVLKGVSPFVEKANTLMRQGEVDLTVVLPPHWQQNIGSGKHTSVQIIADTSDPNVGTIATAYMKGVIASLFGTSGALPFSIQVDTQMLYNPEMKSAYNFVPGIMGLVMIIICTIMTSVSIAREKERGTMEVLLVSPVRPSVMVMSKTVPYFIISVVNIISILLLSYFVLKVPIRGSLPLIILLTTVYVFLALMIGAFISTLVGNQRDAILISGFGMMMPTIVLSGMMFPIQNMPVVLQWLSAIVPARWYVEAIRKVMIQGISLSGVWPELIILAGMCLFLFFISVRNIKPRVG